MNYLRKINLISSIHLLNHSFIRARTLLLLGLLCVLPGLSVGAIKLDIEGAPEALSKNIRLHLSGWESLPAGSPESVERTIRSKINESMQALGYYHGKTKLVVSENHLHITVTPGPTVNWGNVDIQVPIELSALPNRLRSTVENPPFAEGTPINHQVYDNYKNRLITSFQQQGYLDTTWQKSRLQINTQTNLAHVTLHLNLGKRYQVNNVTIVGSQLSRTTTQELIKVKKGDLHSNARISQIYDDLLSSGYFQYVEIKVEKQPPNLANLVIELTDKATDRFSTGLGYGTDTGIRGKVGWTRPQINPRGDNIYSNVQLSQIGEEVTTQYIVPWPNPIERYLAWDTGWKHEETTDRETELLTTGISLNRVERKEWQYKVGINLEHEAYQQGENPEDELTYVLPNFNFLKRMRLGDSGSLGILKYWFDSSVGISILEDKTRFLSLEIGALYSVEFENKHGFATRFDLGAIFTEEFNDVPVSKRFYTGGDQSVRGYRYNSLSSRDENDELQGGQQLNVFSLEYRYRFAEEWKIATFIDTGRAYISTSEPFSTGAGIGLRWEMPVGMIAFDVAAPVDNATAKATRIHIYMSTLL